MLAKLASLALALAPVSPDSVPDDFPVHLTVVLRAPSLPAMEQLAREQEDRASPEFRKYLTPEEFGARFGQSNAVYQRLLSWFGGAGFEVAGFPNRLVVEATGTAAAVRTLVGTTLISVPGAPAFVHVPNRPAVFPPDLASEILHVAGLDTRNPYRHRLVDSYKNLALGPQDLRRFYNLGPIFDAGFAGGGAQLVVLGIAEPTDQLPDSTQIGFFFRNASDSVATFAMRTPANPTGDFDTSGVGKGEQELDVEMQSVGAPEAATITLDMPPASEIFISGPNDIVNNLSQATVVSTSYGICERFERENSSTEPAAMRQLVLQGVVEGQTWFAATGDNGSDDCQDGKAPAIDFPASMPEIVAVGGTEPTSASWDENSALTGYQMEQVWNDGAGNGAAGGGPSFLFSTPTYQTAVGVGANRAVPDLSLFAGASPGAAADDTYPEVFDSVGGTSVSAPLAAGFVALLADRLGCRLGDIHSQIYALGLAQLDGGARVFHDVAAGSVAYDGQAGASAGVGFDLASGWGSLDVAALAAAFPACPAIDAGSFGFPGPGMPYDPCRDLACDGGTICQTLPEGPSRCVALCDGGCPPATACDQTGACVPGKASAAVGDGCQTPIDCTPDQLCVDEFGNGFPGGLCTQICVDDGGICPAGALCAVPRTSDLPICVLGCDGGCRRPGYSCVSQGSQGSACLPECSRKSDCDQLDPAETCDLASGLCVPGSPASDAGGHPDGGAPRTSGGGCTSSGGGVSVATWLVVLLMRRSHRRLPIRASRG